MPSQKTLARWYNNIILKAAKSGNNQVIFELLLKYDINLNFLKNYHKIIAKAGNLDLIKYLAEKNILDKKIIPNTIFAAYEKSKMEIVKYLETKYVDTSRVQLYPGEIYDLAVIAARTDNLILLIEMMKKQELDYSYYHLCHIAIINGSHNIISYLTSKKFDWKEGLPYDCQSSNIVGHSTNIEYTRSIFNAYYNYFRNIDSFRPLLCLHKIHIESLLIIFKCVETMMIEKGLIYDIPILEKMMTVFNLQKRIRNTYLKDIPIHSQSVLWQPGSINFKETNEKFYEKVVNMQ